MPASLDISPALGDAICAAIEGATGKPCHIVLIACPVENDKLGQPTFITSLPPPTMEDLITQIAGGFVLAGKPTIREN